MIFGKVKMMMMSKIEDCERRVSRVFKERAPSGCRPGRPRFNHVGIGSLSKVRRVSEGERWNATHFHFEGLMSATRSWARMLRAIR